ncbi:M48 family metallopeptidase [Paracoccus lutimaris]|uniref:Zn-dependent protease with chaperone function n=1 Tax=Paracoccus lutimaris TaxID=1490030 RepID=A0A368YIJ7_9RHOB|nr:M48 family metallopeptidase [Paracoccus lutimaris]RCW79995.1 Zn-dependent protease with chaperone function [Paracoccus lutimaris]
MCAHDPRPQDFTRYRHRWEMPLIWLCALITIAAVILGLGIFAVDEGTALNDALGQEDASLLRGISETAFLILFAPIGLYIYRFYLAAQSRANGILVGERQFPELFTMYQEIGRRLEMPKLPRLYVVNGNGVVNAFALECNRRYNYVVIHAEIAMLLPTAPDVVEFVLAHELGHHKLRHVSLWRAVIGILPGFTVLLGLATTRAQEYSADRIALAVCPGSARATRLLAVGPWMESGVNADAWLEQCNAEHRELWVRVTQAMSSHAVMVKRYKALREIERDGFSAQGEMF